MPEAAFEKYLLAQGVGCALPERDRPPKNVPAPERGSVSRGAALLTSHRGGGG